MQAPGHQIETDYARLSGVCSRRRLNVVVVVHVAVNTNAGNGGSVVVLLTGQRERLDTENSVTLRLIVNWQSCLQQMKPP